jgi:hypothetical protein
LFPQESACPHARRLQLERTRTSWAASASANRPVLYGVERCLLEVVQLPHHFADHRTRPLLVMADDGLGGRGPPVRTLIRAGHLG